MQQSRHSWHYYSEPLPHICQGLKHRLCYHPRGKTIGGSGAINGMIYVEGHRKDFDDWLAAGNTKWGWADVKRYYEKAVRPVGNATHPKGYVVLTEDYTGAKTMIDTAIFNATAELGLPRLGKLYNGIEVGTMYLPITIKDGRRMSTGKVHLAKVSGRPNLHVIKNAHVRKIHFDRAGTIATKVTFVLRGMYELSAKVRKEVVLSAGTIDSPKLLLLSGVGPHKHLKALRIPVVRDLEIGTNLCDHVITTLFFRLPNKTLIAPSQLRALDGIYDYLIHNRGNLRGNPSGTTSFVNTKGDSAVPDLQLHYTLYRRENIDHFRSHLSRRDDKIVARLSKHFKDAHLISFMLILAKPRSVGKLRLRSADYLDPPRMYSNYLDDPEDVATLLRGIRFLERLERTKTMRALNATLIHIPCDECDGYKYRTDAYWRCYIKYMGEGGFHHTSTVKMGPKSDRDACVDPRLLLYGVKNVRVADASIMPDVPRSNTNAPTIMIGERAADFIKEDWKECDERVEPK
ncbi:glucose dehydrogenase [FAD, quinone] isoform X1 [Zeugodacus cucurbitae]|uniref:glucose dehydrogenase [FAD, quinone] isoform X1 n=1 Tax=Zeugodacus cucurbitae TaxID=28588 RepID=UPI0023D95AD6|nr:glucose dehydrogenase [FAD, quinone] isoform X1 [Zeugodacus cucurbitae]